MKNLFLQQCVFKRKMNKFLNEKFLNKKFIPTADV